MRINDWSSDVCSSDLPTLQAPTAGAQATPAACLHCPRNVRPMPQVAAISQQIWDMKYRLKAADGAPVDKTIEDTWRRVARALAAPEKDADLWAERFYEAMEDFRFLPAGRIVAGAGAGRNVTLLTCFAMGTVRSVQTTP